MEDNQLSRTDHRYIYNFNKFESKFTSLERFIIKILIFICPSPEHQGKYQPSTQRHIGIQQVQSEKIHERTSRDSEDTHRIEYSIDYRNETASTFFIYLYFFSQIDFLNVFLIF